MRQNLSRRHCLSLGLAFLAACGGDDSNTTGGTAGSGGSGTAGSGGSGTAGSGGSGTAGSGGSGTAGSGGSGTAGSGGSGTGGAAGSAGTAGKGGAAGSIVDAGGGDGSNAGCGMAVTALISMNHATPHVLSIPPADVMAGVDKTYNARGQSNHDHFVQLTAADFATLKAGGTVTKKSCNSNDHEFVFSCAPPSRQPGTPTCSDECGAMMGMVCP